MAAQFFYVAAQTGIFSFFINYIATDIPALRQNAAKDCRALPTGCTERSLDPARANDLFRGHVYRKDVTNLSALVAKLQNDSGPKNPAVVRVHLEPGHQHPGRAGRAANTDQKEFQKNEMEASRERPQPNRANQSPL